MAKQLVSDALWAGGEPLLQPPGARGRGGHPPVPNRVALAGIVFVLRAGIPWEYFPQELGCSGMTLWRRLRDWQRAGVWAALHRALLERLAAAGKIDWSRASADASRVPAKGGAPGPAPTRPTAANDRGGPAGGPLAAPAPPLKRPRGGRGPPRRRPAKLHADKAYASKQNR